jgi:phosphonate transport system substrate-binding protein
LLALIAVGAIVGALSSRARGQRLVVDMADAVASCVAGHACETNSPALNVAISAMISPEATRDYYQDLIALLAKMIGRRAVFLQRRTYAEVNALVESRKVDVAFVCAGPYVTGHASFGMEILAVPVVHGEKVYYSYILAQADSSVRSLSDLRNKRFAFTDPDSNTGCLVPTYMLAQQNESPKTFFGSTFFSNSHDNSIVAVSEGRADGAAVDSLIWDFFNAATPGMTKRTRIVEKSPPYGMPPIVVHPDMPRELKAQLQSVFLGLHKDPAAKALLARLQIERFEEGEDAAYDAVREMQRWVRSQEARAK